MPGRPTARIGIRDDRCIEVELEAPKIVERQFAGCLSKQVFRVESMDNGRDTSSYLP